MIHRDAMQAEASPGPAAQWRRGSRTGRACAAPSGGGGGGKELKTGDLLKKRGMLTVAMKRSGAPRGEMGKSLTNGDNPDPRRRPAPTAATPSRGGDKMAAPRAPLSASPAPVLCSASSPCFNQSAGGISADRPISVRTEPGGDGSVSGGESHKMAVASGPPFSAFPAFSRSPASSRRFDQSACAVSTDRPISVRLLRE